MSQMTNYLEAKLLDHTFRNVLYTPPATIYVALYTATPTAAAGTGTEVTGGSYARQSAAFTAAAAGGTTANSAIVTFASLPAATITYIALLDALTVGNMLMFGALTTARTTVAGDSVTIAVGDLALTFV